METVPERPAYDGACCQRLQDRSPEGAGATRHREQDREGPHKTARRPDTLPQG
jgi:hypothetical protein